jgi:hypothetical protein
LADTKHAAQAMDGEFRFCAGFRTPAKARPPHARAAGV